MTAPLAVLLLAGCSTGPDNNTEPCAGYETAYNELQDAVNGNGTPAEVRSLVTGLPGQLRRALDGATGEVEAVIKDSRDYALRFAAGNDDAGQAFFLYATTDVADACAAAGRPLDLH